MKNCLIQHLQRNTSRLRYKNWATLSRSKTQTFCHPHLSPYQGNAKKRFTDSFSFTSVNPPYTRIKQSAYDDTPYWLSIRITHRINNFLFKSRPRTFILRNLKHAYKFRVDWTRREIPLEALETLKIRHWWHPDPSINSSDWSGIPTNQWQSKHRRKK